MKLQSTGREARLFLEVSWRTSKYEIWKVRTESFTLPWQTISPLWNWLWINTASRFAFFKFSAHKESEAAIICIACSPSSVIDSRSRAPNLSRFLERKSLVNMSITGMAQIWLEKWISCHKLWQHQFQALQKPGTAPSFHSNGFPIELWATLDSELPTLTSLHT